MIRALYKLLRCFSFEAYFQGQLRGLMRRCPSLDFCFLEGQLSASVAPEALGAWQVALSKEQRRAWQYFPLQPAGSGWRAQEAAQGLEQVWQAAQREKELHGAFFAALGFSQGANVALALLAKQQEESLGLRCTVNLCGGIWGWWHDKQLPVKGYASLHVLGRSDPYLEQSKALVEGDMACHSTCMMKNRCEKSFEVYVLSLF